MPEQEDPVLQPGDLVLLLPSPTMRVWFTGQVLNPGRIVIPEPLRLNSEIVEARWVSPDKLPEPIPSAQKRAIAIALRGGRPSREGGLRESAD